MSSADLLVSSLSEIKGNEKFEHYDPDLCSEIQSRINSSLKTNGYSIEAKEKFVSFRNF
jgi:hypothetical protein